VQCILYEFISLEHNKTSFDLCSPITYWHSTSGGDIYYLLPPHEIKNEKMKKSQWKSKIWTWNVKSYVIGLLTCVVRMQTSTWITGTCSRPFVVNNFNPTINVWTIQLSIYFVITICIVGWFDFVSWCFNATFSNISAILWRPALVMEEAGENHRPWASNW